MTLAVRGVSETSIHAVRMVRGRCEALMCPDMNKGKSRHCSWYFRAHLGSSYEESYHPNAGHAGLPMNSLASAARGTDTFETPHH